MYMYIHHVEFLHVDVFFFMFSPTCFCFGGFDWLTSKGWFELIWFQLGPGEEVEEVEDVKHLTAVEKR